ncbi:hypothetical protein REPUB_Repub07fG0172700 [Reevesia pubescens]
MNNIGLNCVKGVSDENLSIYQVTEDGHERVYFVQFAPPNVNISCSCNMFGTLGLLCRHALRVLIMNNVKEIPEPYILKRWTKRAKSVFASDFSLVEKEMTDLENFVPTSIQEDVSNNANEVHNSIHEKLVFDPVCVKVNFFGAHNQFIHPLQDFSSNWRFNLQTNLSFTRMLQENNPSPFMTQVNTCCF